MSGIIPVAFLGLGTMGTGMARALLKVGGGGVHVTLYNRDPAKAERRWLPRGPKWRPRRAKRQPENR